MCHALFKPKGDLPLSEWRGRRSGLGGGKCELGKDMVGEEEGKL